VSTVQFSVAAWRKSSFSGDGSNSNCVEVAVGECVWVRDSKALAAGQLAVGVGAWAAFVSEVRR
jgi:hypothetical protein